MARKKRYWRYRVTGVEGTMVGRVAVGDTTIDTWHGKSHTYTVMSLRSGEVTGTFTVELLGEASPEQAERMEARRAA